MFRHQTYPGTLELIIFDDGNVYDPRASVPSDYMYHVAQ